MPAKKAIFDRFLRPLDGKAGEWIGVELEFPILRRLGGAADPEVSKALMRRLQAGLSLQAVVCDRNDVPLRLREEASGDEISFEYSLNTIEFSLAKRRSLSGLSTAFDRLFHFANAFLLSRGHLMSGLGVHPYADGIRTPPLESPYYRMIHAFLSEPSTRGRYRGTNFNAIICSAQTHLDVPLNRIAETLNVFSSLGWVKAFLFSNSSVWNGEIDPQGHWCARDRFWSDSRFATNPLNVGSHDARFVSVNDIIDYDMERSIFHVKRAEEFLFFEPLPLREFFARPSLRARALAADGVLRRRSVSPRPADIASFRGYKHAELTPLGTLEVRSECQQPVVDALAPAAFHVGVLACLDEVKGLLAIPSPGTNSSRRRLAARGRLPIGMTRRGYSRLAGSILDAARRGLERRGLGEERFLSCLYPRAERMSCPAADAAGFIRKTGSIPCLVERFSSL